MIEKLDESMIKTKLPGFKSLFELCQHIVLAELRCVLILSEQRDLNKDDRKDVKNLELRELFQYWKKLDVGLKNLSHKSEETKIELQQFSGIKATNFVLQFPFHSAYHRGQLTVVLKLYNCKTENTDLLTFLSRVYSDK